MMRKFTLGLIGAAMIALPGTLASAQSAAQGNSCAPGSKAAACATSSAPQAGQKQQQQKAAPAQPQQAKASGKSAEPKAQQVAKAQPVPAAMKKGQKFGSGGEKLPDPKAYGLKEQRGASYFKKDGQVYRIDNQTREILAVVGAVADLLN